MSCVKTFKFVTFCELYSGEMTILTSLFSPFLLLTRNFLLVNFFVQFTFRWIGRWWGCSVVGNAETCNLKWPVEHKISDLMAIKYITSTPSNIYIDMNSNLFTYQCYSISLQFVYKAKRSTTRHNIHSLEIGESKHLWRPFKRSTETVNKYFCSPVDRLNSETWN